MWLDAPAVLAGVAFVVAGAGMGFGFSRTGVAMLAASTDRDRGFNSSALTIADSIGAALALSLCGIGFTLAERTGGDPFLAVFGVAVVAAAGAVVTAWRTSAALGPLDGVPHVGGVRRAPHAQHLEVEVLLEALEQPLAATQHHRRRRDGELVDDAGREPLADQVGAAAEGHDRRRRRARAP